MRIFVFEYTCAMGQCSGDFSRALSAEGLAMLGALSEDFARVPGVELTTLIHESCELESDRMRLNRIGSGQEAAGFRTLVRDSAATLVIAPEFDNILFERCCWVEELGGRLLSPSSESVKLTGDKFLLERHLRCHGIPTTTSRILGSDENYTGIEYPAVLKPRHGAGSLATFVVRTDAELSSLASQARSAVPHDELLLQRFLEGQPASVSFLIGPRQCIPLVPATQRLTEDGRLHYLGGSLPLAADLSDRAIALSRRAVQSVVGLRGYVGVDIILGKKPSEDRVIEINPRLTTSYVGLRALAEDNLAEVMFRLANGETVSAIRWRPGKVRFDAGGRTEAKSIL